MNIITHYLIGSNPILTTNKTNIKTNITVMKAYLYYSITTFKNKSDKVHKVYLSIENFYIITDLKTKETVITYNENNIPQPAYSIKYATYEKLLIKNNCVIP